MRIRLVFTVCLSLWPLSGCGSAVADRVSSAADARDIPDQFVVTYDDHDPRWGGSTITLRADGDLTMIRRRPGGDEASQEVHGTVPEDAVQRTVELLAQLEAWEQRVEPGEARIDDAKARLVIEVGDARSRIWEWANDLETNGRIIRVKQHLEGLALEIRHPMIDEAGEPPVMLTNE